MKSPPTPAASSSPCACIRLRRASRALTQLYDDVMGPTGLHLTQYALLNTISRHGTIRITALAAAQLLDRTALSRNLDPLVARGLVAVAPGRDARTREVSITRDGETARKAARPYWQRTQQIVEARLGKSKLGELIELLGEVEALHPGNLTADPTPIRGVRHARRS